MTGGLPAIIPLFPLPNLVFFPDGDLPLHIFEPRYRAMTNDAARGDRIIGMLLLKGDWEREYYGYPETFQIGCAGRIEQLAKLPDGRFNMVLHGVSEFKIRREIREREYRQACVEWCPSTDGLDSVGAETMESLRNYLYAYVGDENRATWQEVAEKKNLGPARLINFLCSHLDLTPLEKQTLLEALEERATRLRDVLTFRLEERKLGHRVESGSRTMQ